MRDNTVNLGPWQPGETTRINPCPRHANSPNLLTLATTCPHCHLTQRPPELDLFNPDDDCCGSGRDKICTDCANGIHSCCKNNRGALLRCTETGELSHRCRCSSTAHDHHDRTPGDAA